MSRPALLLLLSCVVSIGCLPGLEFEVVGDAGADSGRADTSSTDTSGTDTSGTDTSGTDTSGTDTSGTDTGMMDDGCSPEVTCEGGCPMPWLLAAVEDLDPARCGDRVWRWSLQPGLGEFCACTGYRSDIEQSRDVAFVPPSTIVVGGAVDVVALNADSGAPIWSETSGGDVKDLFAIEDDAGTMRVGIAHRGRGVNDIGTVDFLNASDGRDRVSRRTNDGTFPYGTSMVAMTQSSHNRNYIRALKQGVYAAGDADPWLNEFLTPNYVNRRDGYNVLTLHSYYFDGSHRTAWTGIRADASRVFHATTAMDEYEQSLGLGNQCNMDGETRGDFGVVCEFDDAVADPHSQSGAYAICSAAGETRNRVVFNSLSRCWTMALSDIISSSRVVGLSIAVPNLWQR